MGLINNALFIGRSALTAYQSALQVIGNNISNAGNPDYVRQNPLMSRIAGQSTPSGFMPGNGVRMSALQRHIDEALEGRLRNAFGDRESSVALESGFQRLESIVNELSDDDLSSRLTSLFGAFSELQSDPTSMPKRRAVADAAQRLVQEIGRQRSETVGMRDEANNRISFLANRADELLTDIADLNTKIVEAESGGEGTASALRDERDAHLRELSGIIDITVREQEGGAVNVYIGNEAAVQYGTSRGLVASSDFENGVANVNVRFADNDRAVSITGGELEGVVGTRDTQADGHRAALDALSVALIREVNIAHSSGQGLVGMSQATGTYGGNEPALSLADITNNGLLFAPQNGSFQIVVTDPNGTQHTPDIYVRIGVAGVADTTMNGLQAALNAVSGISASVGSDGKLSITADNNYSFTFANDTSYTLAAVGINTFFTGREAFDMAVSSVIQGDVRLIAAAADGATGDGTNAQRIADVLSKPTTALSNVSIEDYYNTLVSGLAVDASASISGTQASSAIVDSLVAQREAVSGVSLDEEALQLIKFERAFQGASRYVAVVDSMLKEMMNLVR